MTATLRAAGQAISYAYDRERLHTLQTETAANRKVMDNVYGYDAVSNNLSLANNSAVPPSSLV